MASVSEEWPTFFPDGCPAAATPQVDGPVFRFSTGSTDDWKCAKELGHYSRAPECQRSGLSCYRTVEDLRAHARILPKFREAKVSRADLRPDHGKILQTGRLGHHTLWLRARYYSDCSVLFQEII